MPHSLSAKLSGLQHKQYITEDEYKRLREALRIQREIEDIKAETKQAFDDFKDKDSSIANGISMCRHIIDKHISGKESNGDQG